MAARFGRIVCSEHAAPGQSLSWAPAAGRRYAKNAAANELRLAEKMSEPLKVRRDRLF